ncbi:MAG: T9SS type A sorting domain-containing protein [Bacteroidales bacterium]|nr:T9SS type A sorting domain-containing protein [Bacteroidales bacterium]
MKKIFTFIALICMALLGVAQTINLAYFPFTGNSASPNTPTSFMAAAGEQIGTAGLYLDGTHGSSEWLPASELTSNGGSAINALNGEAPGQDLATINNSANGKSIVFHFSTTGYQQVTVSMAARRSGQGFNSTVWSYSTDGTNFTTITGASTVPSAASTYELKVVDLTGITAINEQANVYLKCTYDGAQSASASFRIDNVQINALPAGPDVYAPYITQVSPTNASTVVLTFNEALDATTAQTASNYVLNDGTISQAVLNNNTVTLTVTPDMTEGLEHTLIVSNVTDLVGNVMNQDTLTFTYGVDQQYVCATIAELRSKLDFSDNSANVSDNTTYKLTGEVVVTAVAAYNNQKVIQDATGAILVYDPNGTLGTLSIGDKVSGIYGTLTNYYGFLEFKPTAAYENFISSFEDVTPLTITLSQLNDNNFMMAHQAELIKLNDVTFNEAGTTCSVLTPYGITQDGSTSNAFFAYFQDAEYIGNPLPSYNMDLVGVNFATGKIGSAYLDFRYYIIPRNNADFAHHVGITEYDNAVQISPNPVADNLHITFNAFQATTMQIFDITGKMVMSNSVDGDVMNVSVANLTAGTYFVRLSNAHDTAVAKFVKR